MNHYWKIFTIFIGLIEPSYASIHLTRIFFRDATIILDLIFTFDDPKTIIADLPQIIGAFSSFFLRSITLKTKNFS